MQRKYVYLIFFIIIIIIVSLFFVGRFFVTQKVNQASPKNPETTTTTLPPIESNNNVTSSTTEKPIESTTTTTLLNNNQAETVQGVTFAVLGDTKTFTTNPNGNLEQAVKSLGKQSFDLAFVMGDLVSSCDGGSSCENKYNDWKSVMAPILSKTYEVVGNHDRTGGTAADAVWQKEFNLPTNGPSGFSEMAYSFDKGNSHFVVLTTEKPKEHSFDSVQQNWLEQDLSANKKENVFVFFHEPLFQMSQDKKDAMDSNPQDRDVLWNILKKHNVTAVFNGHLHMFARKNQQGIQQIVVGDTDSTADDVPQSGLTDFGLTGHHYSIVTVNGKNVNLKTYSLDGNLVNDFSFSK